MRAELPRRRRGPDRTRAPPRPRIRVSAPPVATARAPRVRYPCLPLWVYEQQRRGSRPAALRLLLSLRLLQSDNDRGEVSLARVTALVAERLRVDIDALHPLGAKHLSPSTPSEHEGDRQVEVGSDLYRPRLL